MWRDGWLMAGKDLRIEARSRVAINQVAPFAVLVLILFGFALDNQSDSTRFLREAGPGLFWFAVLFCALLAVQRSFAVETTDSANDSLRMSGMDPGGIFLGKAAAIGVELIGLEALLVVGLVVLYGVSLTGAGLLVTSALAASAGLAACGTIYGAMSASLKVRETLLPLLLIPVVAPVMIGATGAWGAALGLTSDDGWRWVGLLVSFAVIYLALGVLAFGSLMEQA
jgi:heme exporter protein B